MPVSRPKLLVAVERTLRTEAACYALSVVLDLLPAECRFVLYSPREAVPVGNADAVVSYGHGAPELPGAAHLHVPACPFFTASSYLHRRSLPEAPVPFRGSQVLYGAAGPGGPGPLEGDFVASAFFLLTGYEELVASGRTDKRGRRPAEDCFVVKHSLLSRPLVNEYAGILREALRERLPRLEFPDRSWNGRDYALVVSRDIDSLCRYPAMGGRAVAGSIARGRLRQTAAAVRARARVRLGRMEDPHDNLHRILEWERSLGIRSSIYLMSSTLPGDANYELAEARRRYDWPGMQDQGWELGFHPGHSAFTDAAAFNEEAGRFRDSVPGESHGGRQHGLRFRPPYTWRLWEDAGFTYDSSAGFAEHEGFKSGICTPYRPFDLLEGRQMDLWELPLTVMDCTLDRYRGLSPEEARDAVRRLREQVKRHRGLFMLLWHNSYFGRENAGAYHDVLADLVTDAVADQASVLPAIQALRAWQSNEQAADKPAICTSAPRRAG